jgi:hypothetical protein
MPATTSRPRRQRSSRRGPQRQLNFAPAPAAGTDSGQSRRPAIICNIVRITGNEHAPRTVMFPAPAAATLTDSDLWTPSRLR